MFRGLRLQCPLCTQGRLFHRWFDMVEDCPRCGLHFERVEGHWIGSLGLNTVVSFGTLMISIFVGVLATYPDIPTVPLTIVSIAIALIVPIVFFPASRTIWTAIDLAMRPPDPDEADFDCFEA